MQKALTTHGEFIVAEREAPRMKIFIPDIIAYIMGALALADVERSEDCIIESLNRHISYAPTCLARTLAKDQKHIDDEEDFDLQCVTTVSKLLVNHLLPPPGLCASTLAIFTDWDGRHLAETLFQSNTPAGDILAKSLEEVDQMARLNRSKYKAARRRSIRLVRRIERLPTEIIDLIIETSVFSESRGSHCGLHTIRAFIQDDQHPAFSRTACEVIKSMSTRRRVHDDWRIHNNLTHLKKCAENKHRVGEDVTLDIPSWTVGHCFPCFKFLVASNVVHASSFNSQGSSLLLQAHERERVETGAYIIASMDSEQLSAPISSDPFFENITVIVTSTWRPEWFRACWDRIKKTPELTQTFGYGGIQNICQFVDIDLAEELLQHGIDLGEPIEDHDPPSWYLWGREDAREIWDWLIMHGHGPPANFLTLVTVSGRIEHLSWALQHTDDYHSWRSAADFAAHQTDMHSAKQFEIILHHSHPNTATDPTVFEDLITTVVQTTCNCRDRWAGIYAGQPFVPWNEDPDGCQFTYSALEETAVRKIKAMRAMGRTVEVLGLKIISSEAGLHRITESLEELGAENCGENLEKW